MEFHFNNVNDAFRSLVGLFAGRPGSYGNRSAPIVREKSRNGPVLRFGEPVTITLLRPRERVLFNPVRDANPFFHLYESLWMLVGRNDVSSVAYYAKQIKEYSDDGRTLNGAYGYRWRNATEHDEGDVDRRIDQLDLLVARLKADPGSRRAVLTMWNVEDDLLKIGKVPADYARGPGFDVKPADWLTASKDVCCNLNVMFSLRPLGDVSDSPEASRLWGKEGYYLDATVINRSNDLLWGLLGANVVHFSFLLEYLAARLGAEVGTLTTFSNNLHVYAERPDWRPDALLAYEPPYSEAKYSFETVPLAPGNYGPGADVGAAFDKEIREFVERFSSEKGGEEYRPYRSVFLDEVAAPLLTAFARYKKGDLDGAVKFAETVVAGDWRRAGVEWLKRRIERRAAKDKSK